MKRLLTYAVGLLLIAGMGWTTAQNVNRSIQLSQDPSGPIGFDNLNGSYFPGKLYNTNNQSTPAVAACGTGPTITGTDTAANIVEGTGTVSSCTVTFARAYPSTPYCLAVSTSGATPVGVTPTPNGVTLAHNAAALSMRMQLFCWGQQP